MPRRQSQKGKKLTGEALKKLQKHNAILHERYKNDMSYRNKFFVQMTCLNCGKIVSKYKANANEYCSVGCRWQYIKKTNPIRYKAMCLSANLLMGKGKTDTIELLVKGSLGWQCKYCERVLTLKNIGLDHKIPIRDNQVRRVKSKSKEIREKLDKIENLQIICRSCNSVKGNISDKQYGRLLDFLQSDQELKQIILKRLNHSMFIPPSLT